MSAQPQERTHEGAHPPENCSPHAKPWHRALSTQPRPLPVPLAASERPSTSLWN